MRPVAIQVEDSTISRYDLVVDDELAAEVESLDYEEALAVLVATLGVSALADPRPVSSSSRVVVVTVGASP